MPDRRRMLDDKDMGVAEIEAELAKIWDGGLANRANRTRAEALLLRRSELTGIPTGSLGDYDEDEWVEGEVRSIAFRSRPPPDQAAWDEEADARTPATRADLQVLAKAITDAMQAERAPAGN